MDTGEPSSPPDFPSGIPLHQETYENWAVDRATDAGVPGAQPPALSAARPRADHPEWDVIVWFDVMTFPTAPRSHAFYREMEAFFFANCTGSYAGTRAEWSKGLFGGCLSGVAPSTPNNAAVLETRHGRMP